MNTSEPRIDHSIAYYPPKHGDIEGTFVSARLPPVIDEFIQSSIILFKIVEGVRLDYLNASDQNRHGRILLLRTYKKFYKFCYVRLYTK